MSRIDLNRLWRKAAPRSPDASPANELGDGPGRSGAAQESAADASVHDRADEWPAISFEERMNTAQFNVHERAHITVDGDACRGCTTKQCVVACPANLFVPLTDGGILFNYEQCFECGTCYLVCNTEGAITWTYPEGGHGVIFKRT